MDSAELLADLVDSAELLADLVDSAELLGPSPLVSNNVQQRSAGRDQAGSDRRRAADHQAA